jgi:hypothetical protein
MNHNRSATWNKANAAAQDRHDTRKAEVYRRILAELRAPWAGHALPAGVDLEAVQELRAAELTRAIGPVL